MANHKSAKKRSRQTLKKNGVNTILLSKIRTDLNIFKDLLKEKNKEDLDKSLSSINSSLSKALKKGLIKKNTVSRKLSSLSKKIKNI
tara:strand:+ start:707 stop:967 length:261 start_codon:yes stop_codon:yes gene_type:complete